LDMLRKLTAKPVYYFIFPVIVAALFGTSLIRVNCPVCGGTGTVAYSAGMDSVRVVSIEPRIISTKQDACTSYVVVKAEPVITVTDTGANDASGYLKLDLIDISTGQTLVSQHLAVKVPANAMTVLDTGTVAFAWESSDTPPEDMDIRASVVNEQVPCLVCGGSGKVGLSSYLLSKTYKDTFVSNIRSQSSYEPADWIVVGGQRVLVGSKEWLDWMELN
jgi:hypothetical protein